MLKKLYNKYVTLYNQYVEQLKKSKHHYNHKNCPLCDMFLGNTAFDPETAQCFGRDCPLCESESFWG